MSSAVMCAHCDERKGGAEGTIWCAACLNWYRNNYFKTLCPQCGMAAELTADTGLCRECQGGVL
jgi:hypothetical protein